MLSELAHEERRSLRSLTATALAASLREIHRERFYGCRSGAEVAAQLARGTAQPSHPLPRRGRRDAALGAGRWVPARSSRPRSPLASRGRISSPG